MYQQIFASKEIVLQDLSDRIDKVGEWALGQEGSRETGIMMKQLMIDAMRDTDAEHRSSLQRRYTPFVFGMGEGVMLNFIDLDADMGCDRDCAMGYDELEPFEWEAPKARPAGDGWPYAKPPLETEEPWRRRREYQRTGRKWKARR
jgi:hypothetical protein